MLISLAIIPVQAKAGTYPDEAPAVFKQAGYAVVGQSIPVVICSK